jgi:hypothetical protein
MARKGVPAAVSGMLMSSFTEGSRRGGAMSSRSAEPVASRHGSPVTVQIQRHSHPSRRQLMMLLRAALSTAHGAPSWAVTWAAQLSRARVSA